MRISSLIAAALVFGSASVATAGEEYTGANGFAASGYDVVAYFDLDQSQIGKPQPGAVPGRTDISIEHDGATYAFSSEANRDRFLANPESFAPQYDGHCAYGMAKGGKVPGNPDLWRIVDGKLYLNITKNVVGFWESDIPGNLKLADGNWVNQEANPASTDPIPQFEPMAPIK